MKYSEAGKISNAFDALFNGEVRPLLLFADTKEIAEILDMHKPISFYPSIQEVMLTPCDSGLRVSHCYFPNISKYSDSNWGVIIYPDDIRFENNGNEGIEYVTTIEPLVSKYVEKFLDWLKLQGCQVNIRELGEDNFSMVSDLDGICYGKNLTMDKVNANYGRLRKDFPVLRQCICIYKELLYNWRWKIE